MTTLAGYASKFYVTTAAGTAPAAGNQALTGLSASLNRVRTELDASYFGSADKGLQVGQKSAEVSFSGDYDPADPALTNLEAAFDSGNDVWFHAHWNGTSGKKVQSKVTNFQIDDSVDGKVGFSCTLKSNGALAASP